MKYMYEAVLTPWEDGFEVEIPDLGIFTQGTDIFDAAYMAQDLLHLWLVSALKDGCQLPSPTMNHSAPVGGRVIAIVVEADASNSEIESMSVNDAAEILNVSPSRIYAMVRNDVLEAQKVGSSILISTASVKERFNNPGKVGRPAHKAIAA